MEDNQFHGSYSAGAAAYRRERSAWCKTHGICVQCGGPKALGGPERCPACNAWQAACMKRRREALIAKGICTRCGFEPARRGKLECAKCALAHRENYRLKKERREHDA